MFRFCERKIRLESLKIIYFSIDSLIRFLLLSEEFHINVSKVKREKFRSFSDMIYRGITDHRLYIDQSISIGSFYTWPPRSNFRALSTRIFVPEARAPTLEQRETTTISFVRVAQATGGPRVSPRVVTRPSRATSRVRENFSILFDRTFLRVGTREHRSWLKPDSVSG